MAKGKYYGPDKNKGVRPTGKDKYYGPNKYKGVVPDKKKSSPAKKKPKTLKEQAKELTDAQYAGALGELEDTRASNINQYNRYVNDRKASLNNELGSNDQTGQIVQNAIAGRKANALANAKAEYDRSELVRQTREQAVQATNTNALTNYEALMKSRGIDPTQVESMKANLATQLGFSQRLDEINRKDEAATVAEAGTAMDTLATQAQMANFNAQANARGRAQTDFNMQYNNTLTQNEKIAAELAKTKLDKGSAELNTYLTLKKEYQQRKAEEAQARLEAAVAMGKQASSDYFKEAKLQLDTRKVDNAQANADRNFTLKQQEALNKWKVQADKGILDKAKFQAYLKKNGIYLADLPPTLQAYARPATRRYGTTRGD